MKSPFTSALFTDLYELTMAQAYVREGLEESAVFELFFRELPENWSYLIAAGLQDLLDALETCAFTTDDLAYLRQQDQFSDEFLERLAGTKFTGDVYALPEGTPVFPQEPLVQVRAPILEAQLVETLVLNQVHYQSLLATKAARIVDAAGDGTVVDFGSRRAHGAEAALRVARCSYLAGAAGTSNVLAGQQYGIPIFGTMAHSYVEAHSGELEALRAFAELYPDTTLLVDTYDTLDGVRKVTQLQRDLGADFRVGAVRLDSGDLVALSRESRRILDEAGLEDVRIIVSGGLDEFKIRDALHRGGPIDGFGVGTSLAVSDDAPGLDMAYKLVAYAGEPRMKLSSSKDFFPDRKQILRHTSEDGRYRGDTLAPFHDPPPAEGAPLLEPVMQGGTRTESGTMPLSDLRSFALAQRERLPAPLREVKPSPETAYPVHCSESLQAIRDRTEERLRATSD